MDRSVDDIVETYSISWHDSFYQNRFSLNQSLIKIIIENCDHLCDDSAKCQLNLDLVKRRARRKIDNNQLLKNLQNHSLEFGSVVSYILVTVH